MLDGKILLTNISEDDILIISETDILGAREIGGCQMREFLMGALTGLGALLLIRSLLPGEALNQLRVWKRCG